MLKVIEWFLIVVGTIATIWGLSIAATCAYIIYKFLKEGDG